MSNIIFRHKKYVPLIYKIYAFGGKEGASYYPHTYEYNTSTDVWTSKTNILQTIYANSGGSLNGKAYSYGGYINGSSPSSSGIINEYTPSTDSWLNRTTITNRISSTSMDINNKSYIAFGYSSGVATNINEEFAPLTNVVTSKTSGPLPKRRLSIGVTILDKGYSFGGHDGGGISDNDQYDPTGNSWVSKTNLSNPKWAMRAGVINNKAYLLSGKYGSVVNTNDEYNPSTNTWVNKTNTPQSTENACASVGSDNIYNFGGYDGSTSINSNNSYNPSTNTWVSKTNMLTSVYVMASATISS